MDSRTRKRLFRDWLGLSCGSDDEALVSRNLHEVFQKVFRKYHLADRLKESSLLERWTDVVGPSLSAHCQPRTVRRGVLSVIVDHPAWLHQITLGHKADMLRSVQERFPHLKVKEISLRIGTW